MRSHKKITLYILFLMAAKMLTAQTVITYPDLPIDSFRSQKYQIRVKTAEGSYKNSFVISRFFSDCI